MTSHVGNCNSWEWLSNSRKYPYPCIHRRPLYFTPLCLLHAIHIPKPPSPFYFQFCFNPLEFLVLLLMTFLKRDFTLTSSSYLVMLIIFSQTTVYNSWNWSAFMTKCLATKTFSCSVTVFVVITIENMYKYPTLFTFSIANDIQSIKCHYNVTFMNTSMYRQCMFCMTNKCGWHSSTFWPLELDVQHMFYLFFLVHECRYMYDQSYM